MEIKLKDGTITAIDSGLAEVLSKSKSKHCLVYYVEVYFKGEEEPYTFYNLGIKAFIDWLIDFLQNKDFKKLTKCDFADEVEAAFE